MHMSVFHSQLGSPMFVLLLCMSIVSALHPSYPLHPPPSKPLHDESVSVSDQTFGSCPGSPSILQVIHENILYHPPWINQVIKFIVTAPILSGFFFVNGTAWGEIDNNTGDMPHWLINGNYPLLPTHPDPYVVAWTMYSEKLPNWFQAEGVHRFYNGTMAEIGCFSYWINVTVPATAPTGKTQQQPLKTDL